MKVTQGMIRPVALLATGAALLALGCGIAAALYVGVGAVASGGGGGGGPHRTVRFNVTSTVDLNPSLLVGSSGNIIGPPQIVPLGPGEWQVTAELNHIPDGESVHLTFKIPNTSVPNGDVQVKSVAFYPVPPGQLPPVVQPPVELGPVFEWRLDGTLGMVLDVSNPNGAPMTLAVEGAESAVVLSGSQIYYDGLGNLTWTPLATATLAPQQLLTIDLPDDAVNPPAPAALLLRYASSVLSCEQRGACQLEISGPIKTSASTWGKVKALYR